LKKGTTRKVVRSYYVAEEYFKIPGSLVFPFFLCLFVGGEEEEEEGEGAVFLIDGVETRLTSELSIIKCCMCREFSRYNTMIEVCGDCNTLGCKDDCEYDGYNTMMCEPCCVGNAEQDA